MRRFAIFILLIIFTFSSGLVFADSSDTGRFGVIIGGQGKMPGVVNILKDLGCGWARINNHLDGKGQDPATFLEAGINLVITFDNHDPSNMDTGYGSPEQFPHAGFPFQSKETYQNNVQEVLRPLLPYLKQGRKVWVQCENEISDAGRNKKSRYWRGTVQQYLIQLNAFYEAVKSVDPSIPVVLTSFPSEGLSAVINQDNPRHELAAKLYGTLLKEGKYDAVDLHFYGCVEEIPAKVKWVKQNMPKEKPWITTENGGPDNRCPHTNITWEQNSEEFERIQAEQVSSRFNACLENGVSICLWFSLFDLLGEASVFTHLGLIDTTSLKGRQGQRGRFRGMNRGRGRQGLGSVSEEKAQKIMESLRKKPAYYAFQSFVASHK